MATFREASLRGLEGAIADMDPINLLSPRPERVDDQLMTATEPECAGKEEMMCKLEDLEAEILTSVQDISQDFSTETGGVEATSCDQVTSTVAIQSHGDVDTSDTRSHDQATSHDQITQTTPHNQETRSHDQVQARSHDQVQTRSCDPVQTRSRDEVQIRGNFPLSSKVLSQGTQFPSATDVFKTPTPRAPESPNVR
jgi:hypothetical protein